MVIRLTINKLELIIGYTIRQHILCTRYLWCTHALSLHRPSDFYPTDTNLRWAFLQKTARILHLNLQVTPSLAFLLSCSFFSQIDPQSSSCWATVAPPIALAYMRVLLSRLVSKRWPSGALSKRCISQPHGCSLLVAWFCQLYRVLVVVVVVTTAGLALTACSTFRVFLFRSLAHDVWLGQGWSIRMNRWLMVLFFFFAVNWMQKILFWFLHSSLIHNLRCGVLC